MISFAQNNCSVKDYLLNSILSTVLCFAIGDRHSTIMKNGLDKNNKITLKGENNAIWYDGENIVYKFIYTRD
jgi:hypothetical protein